MADSPAAGAGVEQVEETPREIDIPDVDPLADDDDDNNAAVNIADVEGQSPVAGSKAADISVEMKKIPTAEEQSVDRLVAQLSSQNSVSLSTSGVRRNQQAAPLSPAPLHPVGASPFPRPPSSVAGVQQSGVLPSASQPQKASVTAAPNAAGAHGTGFLAVPDCIRLHPTLGAYLAEIIGTFIYVLTIALVEINNPVLPGQRDTNTSPMPIGFVLIGVVFTFGYISGGHFNPAVSLAVCFARRSEFGIFRMLAYILCQCGAGVAAGIVAMIVQGSNDIIVPDVNNDTEFIRKGLFAELIYTFALATVVLNVAYSHQRANFFYGFAIGFVVIAGLAAVGGVTGGAFNPAVATGLQASVCLVGRCKPLMHFWLYWLAPFGGALLAAFIFVSQYVPGENQDVIVAAPGSVVR